jgi:hypothetical protein
MLNRFWNRTGNRTQRTAATAVLGPDALEDRTVPTLLGNNLFPADNPWNQKITNAPVAANSSAILNNIITRYGDGRLHPDFGQDYQDGSDLYGIPYNVVHGNSQPKVPVVIHAYPDESDLQNAPIPANAAIEGDFQNGPNVGVDNRGDSHLLVYDVDNNVAYEFYRASRPGENAYGQWHADQETVWDLKTNTFRTLGYTSADAAGLPILPGLVRPDEALPASQGGQGVINHAIRFTLQNNIILDQYVYPASHIANSGNNPAVQPPMGARFRLKASVDISGLNPESKIIAQAMKDYGMIVTFNEAGSYTFQVTITDAGGLSVTSSVGVTVVQTVQTITVTPATATTVPGGQVQFGATAFDQFGLALATQPAFTWSVASGPGAVTATGLYTAPSQGGVTARVKARASGVSGQATITVQDVPFLTIQLPPSAGASAYWAALSLLMRG